MNTMKISLLVCAVLTTGAWAQCGCGGVPPVSPPYVPVPPSYPTPCATTPAPVPLPCPYATTPAPVPLPCPYAAAPATSPITLPYVPAPASPAPCAPPAPPTTPKPKVFINKQPPIVINRPPVSYEVKAGAPVYIKPAPVIIQRPGTSEYRPYVQTITSKPIVVNKKIIKIERPILKKYYEEKYSQTEPQDCGQTIPIPPPLPSPCATPAPPCAATPAPPCATPAPPCATPAPPCAATPAPCPYAPAPAPIQVPISIAPSVPDISALLAGASPSPAPAPKPCGCNSYFPFA